MLDVNQHFGNSRLITAITDEEILKHIAEMSIRVPSSSREAPSVEEFIKKLRKVFESYVDLTPFPYAYFTDGILGALNYAVAREPTQSRFFVLESEFNYVEKLDRACVKIKENRIFDAPGDYDIFYVSMPFSGDGKIVSLEGELLSRFKRIWIDMAYFGSHSPLKRFVFPQQTERLFFSFSKTYGLFQHRIGIVFSKYEDPLLHLLMEKGYYNWQSVRIGEFVIDRFDPFHIYKKYSDSYVQLCKTYDLDSSDSILIALSSSDQFKYWEVKKNFHRVPTGFALNKLANEK